MGIRSELATNFQSIPADCRFAARQFRNSPSVILVAILSIALGIGSATTIFSVVKAIVLNPYPYRSPGRIVQMQFWNNKGARGFIGVAGHDVNALRSLSGVEDAFLTKSLTQSINDAGYAESVRVIMFTPNAFPFLGVSSLKGRVFTDGDLKTGSDPNVVVLNYSFWQHYLGGRANIVGTVIHLDSRPYTVIGVMPRRFAWDYGDVYLPLVPSAGQDDLYSVYLKLRPNVSYLTAAQEVFPLMQRFVRNAEHIEFPPGTYLRAVGFSDASIGTFRKRLLMLFVAVFLLLLISCANVSILLLAQGEARSEELALRCALGATRARILSQLITESIVLALSGGMLGTVLTYGAVHTLTLWLPTDAIPRETVISVDGWVLLFSFMLSTFTGIFFGSLPGLHASNVGSRQSPNLGRMRSSMPIRSRRFHAVLIGGQAALTLLLIVAAGTTLGSFVGLLHEKLGIDPKGVLLFNVDLPPNEYSTWSKRQQILGSIRAQIKQIPGVESVTASSVLLPYGGFKGEFSIGDVPQGDSVERADLEFVDEAFLPTLHIPVLRGSEFSTDQIERGDHVALISETFWREHFGNANPIGKSIYVPALAFGYDGVVRPQKPTAIVQVVGVVADTRTFGVNTPMRSTIYLPRSLLLSTNFWIQIRSTLEPSSLINSARKVMHGREPNLAISSLETMESLLEDHAWSRERLIVSLLLIFSCIALSLAASGVYSTSSYTVSQRTHEFGIRLALGAKRKHILGLVLLSEVIMTLWGVLVGCFLCVLFSVLFHARARELSFPPLLIILGSIIILVFAVLASLLPAGRAASIEPVYALREK